MVMGQMTNAEPYTLSGKLLKKGLPKLKGLVYDPHTLVWLPIPRMTIITRSAAMYGKSITFIAGAGREQT